MEQERALHEFLVASARALDISLTEHQAEQFLVYLSLLLTWNRTTNLTSITDPFEVVSKHFVDSLTALKAFNFPLSSAVIDVGSGAGFPGIPLKLVRNDLRLVLVEPSVKKCSFLRSVLGTLKLDSVSVYLGALQQYAADESHLLADVIAVRALRLEEIIEAAALILKPSGHLLLYQTEKAAERTSSLFRLVAHHDFSLPLNHGSRVVTVLTKIAT
ncbi:MAG TPA: 16S rRNA (guanine(527)-N(7))-methyltransferase RsmG [Nitrospira sp.]|nr:16S rRNA (guanine(527)-N(7))-methyltransferase RsmG [Nitrospira sp.]